MNADRILAELSVDMNVPQKVIARKLLTELERKRPFAGRDRLPLLKVGNKIRRDYNGTSV